MARILFAEDGPTVMNLAGAMFEDPDLAFDVVTDGRSALDRLNQAPRAYDLVILGDPLPEVGCIDCIAYVRKMFVRLPILVLSGVPGEDRHREFSRLGLRQHQILQKPTDPETFLARVRKVLSESPPRNPRRAG